MSEQGTEEWFAERLGKATASRMGDLTAKVQNGWAASRANYKLELVIERLTGKPYPSYVSPEMRWGLETQSQAAEAYAQLDILANVNTVGFVPHPVIAMAGASPDLLVNEDGMAEFKCPNSATHWKTLRDEKIEKRYIDQVQWQMVCAGREWCDWVSFDPRMPEPLRLYVKRVERDNLYIANLENQVRVFLAEVDADVKWALGQGVSVIQQLEASVKS